MTSSSIIQSWKSKQFKPIYWLEGNEDFFIDEIADFAEHRILTEEQASFNLTVFYGKDTDWADVVNACRRYPVFSDRQVVLLKEAQQMKDIDKLEPYMEKPNSATLFVVSYKGKTLDGRKHFAKVVKKNGEVFTSRKIYDNQLPAWTNGYVQSKGFQIDHSGLSLLVSHVGNDLSRITNEINKLTINLKDRKNITAGDIEKYIGISKDYNVFEIQDALCVKNKAKAINIIQYMEANSKAILFQQLLPTLYGFFVRVMTAYQTPDKNESTMRGLFYNNPVAVKQAQEVMKNYSYSDLEKAILLLHHYNLKFIGINSYNTPAPSLMKELLFRIME